METLRERRKALGLTLHDLAGIVGITEGQLSRIERYGKASLPVAMKLEQATGIPAAEIGKPPLQQAQDAAA